MFLTSKILHVAIFLLVLSAFGAAKAELAYLAEPSEQKAPAAELLLLQDSFESLGFSSLNLGLDGALGFSEMHQVFVAPSWNKAVFVRFGWKPSQKVSTEFIKLGPGFALHHSLAENVNIVLFFYGFSESEMTVVTAKLKTGYLGTVKPETAYFNIFPQAHAQTFCANCEIAGRTETQIQTMNTPVQSSVLMSAIGSCAMTMIRGFRDSATGFVQGVGNFLSDPTRLWTSVVENFKNLRGVVTAVVDAFKSIPEVLAGLSPAMLQGVACGVVGGLGIKLLRGLNPAGMASLVAKLAQIAAKLKDSLKSMKRLQGLRLEPRLQRTLSQNIGVCAAH
jgi:hypothetical protein